MRAPTFRGYYHLPGELVIDCFAGGGGASTGIEAAINRPVDIAINHSAEAIAMHKANHPETQHYCEDIYTVDPIAACGGKPVGVAWFSPECTNHSRAKGGKPRDEQSRTTGDVVINWARKVRPKIIICENVIEWRDWGPLDPDGNPDKAQLGVTFRAWCAALTDLGYRLETKTLVAADYGTPTTRSRLFVIAMLEGDISWPTPTHGKGRPNAWRPASEIIDWTLPCKSIFERKRPLAEATLKRIAAGIQRFVVNAANPFIVPLTHQGGVRVHSVGDPLRTVTAAHRGELALAEPFVVRHGHYSNITGVGLRDGLGWGMFRGQQLAKPLATVCTTNDKHLVCPIITKHYGGVVGHDVTRTLGTVTTVDHHSLTAAVLEKRAREETPAEEWARRFGRLSDADQREHVHEFMAEHIASSEPQMKLPLGGEARTNHADEVHAFLLKYYGAEGRPSQQSLFEPLHTVTTKARFGLVMVRGVAYEIVDIGMRMLSPDELFAAMGFPEDYETAPEFKGKPMTKTARTALAGNAVCPQVAEALVRQSITQRLAA